MRTSERDIIHTMPLLRYAVAFAAGIAVSEVLCHPYTLKSLTAAMLGTIACALLLNRRHERLCSILLLISIFTVGMWRATYDVRSAPQLMPAEHYALRPNEMLTRSTLCTMGEPSIHGGISTLEAVVVSSDSGNANIRSAINGQKIRVSIMREGNEDFLDSIRAGSNLDVVMLLRPLSSLGKNMKFDYSRWLRSHGFVCSAFVRTCHTSHKITDMTAVAWKIKLCITARKIRDKAAACLRHAGIEGDAFAIASAMALGDKNKISSDIREEYSAAGVAHILALSGMHLTIVISVLMVIFRRRNLLTSICLIALIWCYVVITGMSLSVVRAACMLTIWELLRNIQREQNSLNVLGGAMLLMLAFSPDSLWDIGFQLSYAAVLGILIFTPHMDMLLPHAIRDRWYGETNIPWHTKTIRSIWGVCAVSISAQAATAPLTAYYFGSLPLYFLLANMIVVPAALFIVPMSLLTITVSAVSLGITGILHLPAIVCGKVLAFVISIQNNLMHLISSLPAASIPADITLIQVCAVYVILITIAVYLGKKSKTWE